MTGDSLVTALFASARAPAMAPRLWLSALGRPTTYGQLCDIVERVGGLLSRLQVRPGDRVVTALTDDGDAAALLLALVCHGVTFVQIDPDTPPARAAGLVARARPALIIADPHLAAAWIGETAPCAVIAVPPPPPARSGGLSALLGGGRSPSGLELLLKAETGCPPPRAIPDETLAYILYTSGTTAASKGVCISHRALFLHLESLVRVYGLDRDSRILNTLMLSHADGVVQGPLMAFACGGSVYRPVRFGIGEIERILDSVFQLRISHMVAVPTMMSLLVRLGGERRDAFQGGDFKALISCGGALEAALWSSMEALFGLEIINGYGLTETVAGGVFAGPGVSADQRGSIGVPVDCELRIIDDAGQDSAEGELLMRGDLVMAGYFDDPQRTAEALVDGWLHTGDIARRDDRGDYWISGRKKSVIIRGGLNIHPEEIAEVLNLHPGVRDSVAFGVPDPEWGETVTALVAADANVTPEALLAFCRGRLELRKTPSRILVTAALPLGRSGKVLLDEARKLAAGATPGAAGPDIDATVLKTAGEIFGVDPARLSLETTPDSIVGWDSLAHLNLVFAIEEAFDIKLTPREIMTLDRLGVIADIVRGR